MPEKNFTEVKDLQGNELNEPLQTGSATSVDLPGSFDAGTESGSEPGHEPAGTESGLLTAEEKDALGEVGNICMGSAATTLAMLTSQPVNITSPSITLTTLKELFKSFGIPHLAIYVRFIGGLTGYNLLIMKLDDATVLADMMMGGDGTNISEELSEIGISAASEAMNQMIGTASTSMATMFGKKVNISPPDTHVYYSEDELRSPELDHEETVVVVRFNITIGAVLNTHIMQVMGVETAREQAGALLRQLSAGNGGETVQEDVSDPSQKIMGDSEDFAITGQSQDMKSTFPEEKLQNDSFQPIAGSHDPGVISTVGREVSPFPAPVRQLGDSSPAAAPLIPNQQHLDLILDIPLKVTVLLGRTKWPIKDILGVAPGSVVELQNQVDGPVEVLVNGTLVAMGEVVVVNENFGVRITNIIGPEDRLKHLGR